MSSWNFFDAFSKKQTFRPKKKFAPASKTLELHKRAEASLRSGLDVRTAVELPEGEILGDWYMTHVIDFYNRINVFYGFIADQCTAETCPVMSGGTKYEYHWQDKNKYKRPTKLPAPEYVREMMMWIEEMVADEAVFPVSQSVAFPKNFHAVCRKIMTRLHRVFIHVYIHHFRAIQESDTERYLNSCYKHFYFFAVHFRLIEKRELAPLSDVQANICK